MPSRPPSRSRSSGGGTRAQGARPPSSSANTRSELFSVQDRRHHRKVLQETQQRRARLLPLGSKDIALRQYLYNDTVNTILDEGAVEARAKARGERIERRQARTNVSQSSPTNLRVQFHESPVAESASGAEGSASYNPADATTAPPPAITAPSLAAELRAAAERRYTHASREPEAATPREAITGLPAQSSTSTAAMGSTGRHAHPGDAGDEADADKDMTNWLDKEEKPQKEMDYEAWLAAGCPTGCWKDLLENDLYGPERAEKAYYALKYRPQRT